MITAKSVITWCNVIIWVSLAIMAILLALDAYKRYNEPLTNRNLRVDFETIKNTHRGQNIIGTKCWGVINNRAVKTPSPIIPTRYASIDASDDDTDDKDLLV